MKAAFVALMLAASIRAANPVLAVNNLTGSDTAASGAPAAFGPVSAAATCHTNGVGSTTIQWAANGISGLATDGSALIWLATASGRRWSQVVSVTASTVVVEVSFNIAAGSPVDCAIGGKRASFTATQTIADLKGNGGSFPAPDGWILHIENTGTNYTSSTTQVATASLGGCLIRGTGSYPSLTIWEHTANSVTLQPNNCSVKNLAFINTNATKTASVALNLAGSNGIGVFGNIIGSSGQGHRSGIDLGAQYNNIYDNEIRFNTSGIRGGGFLHRVVWNWIHDNATGLEWSSCSGTQNVLIFRNLVVSNTGVGFEVTGGGTCFSGAGYFFENVFHANGSHGLNFAGWSTHVTFVDNQVTSNGGFGIRCTAALNGCELLQYKGIVAYNNYSGNTLGARENWPVGENETAVAPNYTSPAAFNWCQSTPTRGGFPGLGQVWPGSLTESFLQQGICQAAGGAGTNLGI